MMYMQTSKKEALIKDVNIPSAILGHVLLNPALWGFALHTSSPLFQGTTFISFLIVLFICSFRAHSYSVFRMNEML